MFGGQLITCGDVWPAADEQPRTATAAQAQCGPCELQLRVFGHLLAASCGWVSESAVQRCGQETVPLHDPSQTMFTSK